MNAWLCLTVLCATPPPTAADIEAAFVKAKAAHAARLDALSRIHAARSLTPAEEFELTVLEEQHEEGYVRIPDVMLKRPGSWGDFPWGGVEFVRPLNGTDAEVEVFLRWDDPPGDNLQVAAAGILVPRPPVPAILRNCKPAQWKPGDYLSGGAYVDANGDLNWLDIEPQRKQFGKLPPPTRPRITGNKI